jgi:DNA replication and repair protein RecF
MVPYNFSPEDFAQFFIQELSYKLAIEIKAGTTLIGSHRDDFKLFVEGFDIGKYGSRGETKIVALSLRMAEASYISSVRRDHPVILLDDVLSELDNRKRKLVLAMASEYGQALITTTDRDVISAEIANGAKYLKVEKGNIY